MTLFKQIFTWITALFILLASSVIFIQLQTTRSYIGEQQQINVSNALHAMRLATEPYIAQNDKVAVDSALNALFDGGYFSKIEVKFLEDNSSIIKQYPIKPSNVPNWFLNMNLFKVIHINDQLITGWKQIAEISITSHTGLAYQQLWNTLVYLMSGFATLFALFLTVFFILLGVLLKPLKEMRAQAVQISDNNFGEPIRAPKTKDLKILVDTFNLMSKKIEANFIEQANEADKLRERAYTDPISGLVNRSYFLSQIDAWGSESGVGGVGLLYVQTLDDIYNDTGYEDGDRAVSELAHELQHAVSDRDITLARFSQLEFAVLMPNASIEDLQSYCERILTIANNFKGDPMGISPEKTNMGVIYSENPASTSDILAKLDNALNQAKIHADSQMILLKNLKDGDSFGKKQWRSLIQEAIGNELFTFKLQNISNNNGKILHSEIFSAIEKQGHYYSASQFLGALEQQNLGPSFDRYVVNKVFKMLDREPNHTPIAINLTLSSITNAAFIRWLKNTMIMHKKYAKQVLFEIPEIAFVRYTDYAAILCENAQNNGFKYGIDNYGRFFKSLEYINNFNPDYVKIDYAYTNNLEEDDKLDIIASICRTAHNLDIETIATRVETKEQLEKLASLHVDAFQGFVFKNDKNE